MKHYLVLIIIPFIFLGCKIQETIPQLPPVTVKVIEVPSKKLPEQYYLKNRIPDCDKAIEFMKSVIKPDSVHTRFGFEDERFHTLGAIHIEIVGDQNVNKFKDIHLFYLNLECLKTLDIFEVLDIFCCKSDLVLLEKELKSEKGRVQHYIFESTLNNMEGFSIVISQSKIVGLNWNVDKSIP